MSEGLITRIGKWIDTQWESKITESQFVASTLEHAEILQKELNGVNQRIAELDDKGFLVAKELLKSNDSLRESFTIIIGQLRSEMAALNVPHVDWTKDIDDLKTRLERIEIYSGLTRKVDPTKAPIVKNAFTM